MSFPAFVGGMPGGMEIAIIVLNLLLLAGIAYAVLGVVRSLSNRPDSDLEARIENLEGQVAALREEIQERDEP